MDTINEDNGREMKLTQQFITQKQDCIRVIESFYETTKKTYDLESQMP